MKKLTMTLVVAALTAASLVAAEGTSFAAPRHANKSITRPIMKKGKKAGKRYEDASFIDGAFGVKVAQHRARGTRGHKGGKRRSGPRGNPTPVIG